MRIENLIWCDRKDFTGDLPDIDPLRHRDGFYEGIILDFHYIPILSRLVLVFDLRQSLSFEDDCNVAILIYDGVKTFNTSRAKVHQSIWNIHSSEIVVQEEFVHTLFADFDNSELLIEAKDVTLLCGFVDDIGTHAANFDEANPQEYRNTTPKLSSEISIMQMSSIALS